MALPSDTTWEVRADGSDTAAGGGFSLATAVAAGGSAANDMTYPTPTVATFSGTLSAAQSSTTLTDSAAAFTPGMVGNAIYIPSGTNFVAGSYMIMSYTNASNVVLDSAPATAGAGSGGTGYVGGALASPAVALGRKAAGNDVWIRSGTYTVNVATNQVANGISNDTNGGSATNWTRIAGYDAAVGRTLFPSTTVRPVFSTNLSSGTYAIILSSSYTEVFNVEVAASSAGAGSGIHLTAGYMRARRCKTTDCNIGIRCNGSGFQAVVGCEAVGSTNTTNGGFTSPSGITVTMYNCEAHGGLGHGFYLYNGNAAVNCVSWGNSKNGFAAAGIGYTAIGCVARGNGQYGFDLSGTVSILSNCIAHGNTSGPFYTTSVADGALSLNCAAPSAPDTNSVPLVQGFVTLTADPFTNGAAGDFTLNDAAGGGALLRDTGAVSASYPAKTPSGATTVYAEFGPATHQAASGGGGGTVILPGGAFSHIREH
jgi:hypothetical protein